MQGVADSSSAVSTIKQGRKPFKLKGFPALFYSAVLNRFLLKIRLNLFEFVKLSIKLNIRFNTKNPHTSEVKSFYCF